ncbi:hypothetical protein QTP81_15590 [Alteromonas sp. ASW11-36]|uniref:Tetratricopeptide repeat protein n=1 Tax=Alteromonas arenosi TaxID=3055817 RepID=A0ABT7T0Q9_9ALTE|nr:hypothetical protein [Alteromonas sp. ASW11-36]MDM7862026.1 hypothetical protein [Alteromonas sp. ASW11-36]
MKLKYFPLKLGLVLVLIALVLAVTTPLQAQDEQDVPSRLEQLRFGQVLYEYFQQQPLATLHAIELAKHNGYPADEQARLQLIEGGANLQLGMTRAATQHLEALLAETQPPEIQAQAWYWLAKTAFQQGAYQVSEQAHTLLQDETLEDYIELSQRNELEYQSAYYQLQTNPQAWQQTLGVIDTNSIWFPYLVANAGIQAFNSGDYELATELFVDAIKSASTPRQNAWDWSFDWFKVPTVSWWPWSEPEAQTPQIDTETYERNVLLDRLYLLLGQAFVQQNNFPAAFNAFKQIQADSLYAEQGLLAYGWALANDSRWSEAMAIWQYLQQSGKGLPALQATHALAYGYEQQTDYQQAFAMLGTSLEQLESARISLNAIVENSAYTEFFYRLATEEQIESSKQWPRIHQDLLVDLLSGDNQTNTAKQLNGVLQLLDVNRLIAQQQQTLNYLEQLLDERTEALTGRAAQLQLAATELTISESEQQLQQYSERVADAAVNPQNLANAEQREQLERVEAALKRLSSIRSNPDLPARRAARIDQRLQRLRGILMWDLQEQQTTSQFAHEAKIAQTRAILDETLARFNALQGLTGDRQALTATVGEQYKRLFALRERFSTKLEETMALQQQLIASLRNHLMVAVAQRDAVLLEQITATRLAMLRMQDISYSRQQQRGGD